MPVITGVRFKEAGKVYYFDPAGLPIQTGDWVVVETAQGKECGQVMIASREIDAQQIQSPLKAVLRIATAEDMQGVHSRAEREKYAMSVCAEKITAHNLPMHLVNVECSFDNSRIVFYFTADGRVDFRMLVRDLATVFRTRIELRQIGVRDETRLLGGLGPCGREVCCRAFLREFSPVSIRMAKDQGISLNPAKISGLCGRLMCCLNYEQDHYQKALARCPKKGASVTTSDGVGTVDSIALLKEHAKVRMATPSGEFVVRDFSFDDIFMGDPAALEQWLAERKAAQQRLKEQDIYEDYNLDEYAGDEPAAARAAYIQKMQAEQPAAKAQQRTQSSPQQGGQGGGGRRRGRRKPAGSGQTQAGQGRVNRQPANRAAQSSQPGDQPRRERQPKQQRSAQQGAQGATAKPPANPQGGQGKGSSSSRSGRRRHVRSSGQGAATNKNTPPQE